MCFTPEQIAKPEGDREGAAKNSRYKQSLPEYNDVRVKRCQSILTVCFGYRGMEGKQ